MSLFTGSFGKIRELGLRRKGFVSQISATELVKLFNIRASFIKWIYITRMLTVQWCLRVKHTNQNEGVLQTDH